MPPCRITQNMEFHAFQQVLERDDEFWGGETEAWLGTSGAQFGSSNIPSTNRTKDAALRRRCEEARIPPNVWARW